MLDYAVVDECRQKPFIRTTNVVGRDCRLFTVIRNVISTGAAAAGAADLGCLDHAYFLRETGGLLQRARAAQHSLLRDFARGQAGDGGASERHSALEELIAVLASHRCRLARVRAQDTGTDWGLAPGGGCQGHSALQGLMAILACH